MSFRQARRLYLSDFYRYGIGEGSLPSLFRTILTLILVRCPAANYTFWWRLASQRNIVQPLARLVHMRLSRIYGVQVPRDCSIGPGLYIGHCVGVVISPSTVIGRNCNISQFLSIGTNDGRGAVIGDNVYIGPHVSIVGPVKIGNNVTIGAGAVVVKDIPNDATVVGNPARVINFANPARFILRRV